jgi:hypothetical protein
VRADQRLQRLLLRPVHAQLGEQAQAVDRGLERLVPLLRRRRPIPTRRGPRLRRREILPARRHLPELLHGDYITPSFPMSQPCFHCSASLSDQVHWCSLTDGLFSNSAGSSRRSTTAGPTSAAVPGDPSSPRATTTMPPSTSSVSPLPFWSFLFGRAWSGPLDRVL